MEIIQITDTDLSIRQAYLQDCIHREIRNVEEIISNASEACYKNTISFLSLFMAGYGVMVGCFVSTCCSSKPSIWIIISTFSTLLIATLFSIINHYQLYKRQDVYRNTLISLELLYENATCNYLSAEQALNGSNVADYTNKISKIAKYKWFDKGKIPRLLKELSYLITCALLTIITAILIICL